MGGVSAAMLGAVAAGGALGSVLRYLVGVWAVEALGATFPWGTLIVNVLGCAAIGIPGGMIASGAPVALPWRLFIVTGVLGGFTTFSSFSLETGLLWLRSPLAAAGYVAASLIGGLAAFGACFAVVRRLGGA